MYEGPSKYSEPLPHIFIWYLKIYYIIEDEYSIVDSAQIMI